MRRRARAYLLIESIVAGGVLTVCIGGALMLASTFRTSITGASRRVEAAQIAESRIEQYLAGDRRATFGPEPVPGHRGFSVMGTAAPVPIGSGTMTSTMMAVSVTVQYPVSGVPRLLTVERQLR